MSPCLILTFTSPFSLQLSLCLTLTLTLTLTLPLRPSMPLRPRSGRLACRQSSKAERDQADQDDHGTAPATREQLARGLELGWERVGTGTGTRKGREKAGKGEKRKREK
jgi:hypothetical protein